jgi:hypothetical protein
MAEPLILLKCSAQQIGRPCQKSRDTSERAGLKQRGKEWESIFMKILPSAHSHVHYCLQLKSQYSARTKGPSCLMNKRQYTARMFSEAVPAVQQGTVYFYVTAPFLTSILGQLISRTIMQCGTPRDPAYISPCSGKVHSGSKPAAVVASCLTLWCESTASAAQDVFHPTFWNELPICASIHDAGGVELFCGAAPPSIGPRIAT